MAELMGYLPGLDEHTDVVMLCFALRKLVVATITATVKLKYPYTETPEPPEPYDEFVRSVLFDLSSWAVINFNYDTALEVALGHRGMPDPDRRMNYGDAWNLPQIFKLHGSLHWTRCSVCRALVPCSWQDLREGISIASQLGNQTHCGQPCLVDPVIVPPTSSKREGHMDLWEVWRRAARELAEARNIFVIGYSLPPTDRFFREMFGLGTIAARLRRIWIFDPVPAPVESRWREFLGPDAARYLRSFALPFSQALGEMRGALMQDDYYG